jgi:sugar phosphate isomerase/epimerase
MGGIPLAVQVYSVRQDAAADLAKTLKALADMGYQGVEFAGFYGHEAADIRRMLDDNGLQCAGSHTAWDDVQPAKLEQTAAYNKTLDNRFLIIPGLPEDRRNSLAAWEETAELFNGLAERAKAFDMRVGYHNHFVEFQEIEGRRPIEVFLCGTREDVVMQFDSGNARHAGADVVPYIRRYPGRAATVHLKEWTDAAGGAVLGEGKTDWPALFEACESAGGTQWYIVEQETYPVAPLDSVRRCIENLRKMGK